MKKLLVAVSLFTLSLSSFAKLSIVDHANNIKLYDGQTGHIDTSGNNVYKVDAVLFDRQNEGWASLVIPKVDRLTNEFYDTKLLEKYPADQKGYFTVSNTNLDEESSDHFVSILRRLHMSPKQYYLLADYNNLEVSALVEIVDDETKEILTLDQMIDDVIKQRKLDSPRTMGEYLEGIFTKMMD